MYDQLKTTDMKKLLTATVIVISIFAGGKLSAQAPPPPPPEHGETGNQNGGNAPIGSGIAILLGLGIAYGGFKGYKYHVINKNDEE